MSNFSPYSIKVRYYFYLISVFVLTLTLLLQSSSSYLVGISHLLRIEYSSLVEDRRSGDLLVAQKIAFCLSRLCAEAAGNNDILAERLPL